MTEASAEIHRLQEQVGKEPNREIMGYLIDDGWTLCIPVSVLARHPELTTTPKEVVKTWKDRGDLIPQGKNLSWPYVPGVKGKMLNYRVKVDQGGWEENEEARVQAHRWVEEAQLARG